MKIQQVELLPGLSLETNTIKSRSRVSDDGPIHVALLGESWVAVWDDRDDEAHLLPRERVKGCKMAKKDLLEILTAPDPAPDPALTNKVTKNTTR